MLINKKFLTLCWVFQIILISERAEKYTKAPRVLKPRWKGLLPRLDAPLFMQYPPRVFNWKDEGQRSYQAIPDDLTQEKLEWTEDFNKTLHPMDALRFRAIPFSGGICKRFSFPFLANHLYITMRANNLANK